jgi:hypothetical protein
VRCDSPRMSLLFGLVLGCSSPAPSGAMSQSAPTDGGLSINVPNLSCPEAGTLVPPDAGACVVQTPRSFNNDVVPLFDGCAGEICHNFGSGAIRSQIGVLVDECCDEISVIDPGHPESSYVVDKLSGKNLCMESRQMPLGQPAFTADEIQIVADWICQGAGTSP